MLTGLRHLRRHRRPPGAERGAVLVEGAIALPVVALIVMAVIEFGLFFATSSATTSASRDGARYGVAHYARRSDTLVVGDEIRQVVERDLEGMTGQGTPVRMWVYKAQADGSPAGGAACASECLRYEWDGSSFVYDVASTPWDDPEACISSGAAPDDLGVLVEVRHAMVSGVIGAADRTLRERTVLRLEPLPVTQC